MPVNNGSLLAKLNLTPALPLFYICIPVLIVANTNHYAQQASNLQVG